HVAHAGRRPAAPAVHALGILAARHLQAVACARELHLLHRARRNQLQDRAPPPDQVRRAGQGLDRGDAAGDGERDLRVLRPEGMFRPHLGGDRVRRVADHDRPEGVTLVRAGVLWPHHARALGRGGLRGRRRGLARAGRRAPHQQHERRVQELPHAGVLQRGYFTSSTTNGWPTNSVFKTRRGVSVLTYMVNGTRDPVTAIRYAWNVPAGTVTLSRPPTLKVSVFCEFSLGVKQLSVTDLPGPRGSAGTTNGTAFSSRVPTGSTVSMS